MSRRSSNVTSEKMGNEIDPGAGEVENRPQIFSIDPDEERKVVRKLDAVIMPLMAVVYFFQCKKSIVLESLWQILISSDRSR